MIADASLIRIDPSAFDTIVRIHGKHIYPSFIVPNTTLGITEIGAVRASHDYRETGGLNPNVRALIAYNTDSKVVKTVRTNGVLIAQVTPRGSMISGQSSVMHLDGWNWEDAMLVEDAGVHMHWPSLKIRRRSPETGLFETTDNEDYEAQTQLLHSLFQAAQTYTGEPLNLNLGAIQPVINGSGKLFIHVDQAKEIISAIRFARSYGVEEIVLVGGAEAMQVVDFLTTQDIPIIYERVHELPMQAWHDVDAPFKTPFLLHDAGLKVGIGGGATSLDRQRNLPFFAGTAAAYGLDRETALSLVTLNSAEILGVADRVGSLEVGKDAALFISEGDALDMRTSQILGAYIQGRDIDLYGTQQELYERFREKYANQIE